MSNWKICYRLANNFEGEVIVPGINRMMAWEMFAVISNDAGWNVVAAECYKVED